jgi:hypothetical protein
MMAQPLSIAVLKTDLSQDRSAHLSTALNEIDPMPFLAFSGLGQGAHIQNISHAIRTFLVRDQLTASFRWAVPVDAWSANADLLRASGSRRLGVVCVLRTASASISCSSALVFGGCRVSFWKATIRARRC